jgi:hypothetical protein
MNSPSHTDLAYNDFKRGVKYRELWMLPENQRRNGNAGRKVVSPGGDLVMYRCRGLSDHGSLRAPRASARDEGDHNSERRVDVSVHRPPVLWIQ